MTTTPEWWFPAYPDYDDALDYEDQFPFIESRALKKKFDDVTVTASTYPEGREVPVVWAEPDLELRYASYPGIYLAYGPVTRATDREHRGATNLTYAPPGLQGGIDAETDEPDGDVQVPKDWEDKDSVETEHWSNTFDKTKSPYHVPDWPIPYNLDFNIAVLTRNYQQAFQIISQLQVINRIPERFGFLEVPEDGTVRTLELLGGPNTTATRDEDGKRLIQTLYSVRVVAELSLYQVEQVQRVQTVNIEDVPFYL